MFKEHSKLNIASVVMLVLIFVMLVGFLWMLHFPRNVWELTTPPHTIGTEFKVGDTIPLEADYCKTKDVKGIMVLQYVDGVIYTTPAYEGNFPVGCGKATTYNVSVPQLPPGEYYLRVTFSHEANTLRTITNTWKTNKFNIVE